MKMYQDSESGDEFLCGAKCKAKAAAAEANAQANQTLANALAASQAPTTTTSSGNSMTYLIATVAILAIGFAVYYFFIKK